MTRQASHARPASPGHNGKSLAAAAILDLPAVDSSAQADDQLQLEILRLLEASRDGRLKRRPEATTSRQVGFASIWRISPAGWSRSN